jgi:hypothetical protein
MELIGWRSWGRADNMPISFFLINSASSFFFATQHTMPNARDPPKRKTRDGSEDAAPRKKQQKTDEVQFEDYGDGAKPKVTRKFKDKFAPKPEKEYPSINDLKKRIRDVKRLLNKVDLPADARILQERALSGYEQDLADETARRERSQMIKKYHFVRFLGMWKTNFNLRQFLANVSGFLNRPQNRHQRTQPLPAPRKGTRFGYETKVSPCRKNPHCPCEPQLHDLLPSYRKIPINLPQVGCEIGCARVGDRI